MIPTYSMNEIRVCRYFYAQNERMRLNSDASDGNLGIPITDPTVPVSEGSDEAVETERGF